MGVAQESNSGKKRRDLMPFVLIVDGDARARSAFAELAREEGFMIVEADGAEAALRALSGGGISLLVSELQLDGPVDGLELISECHRRWPDLPIVAASERVVPFAGVLPDRAAYVGKPYRSKRLAALLRAVP